jgi:hypothetical protein
LSTSFTASKASQMCCSTRSAGEESTAVGSCASPSPLHVSLSVSVLQRASHSRSS